MVMKNIEPSHPDAGAWCDKNLAAVDSLLAKITADEGLEGAGGSVRFPCRMKQKLRRRKRALDAHIESA
jgi:hypothetical protein